MKSNIPFWRQLRWNLAIYFVIMAVLPVLITGYFNLTQTREQTIKQVTAQLESVAELKREHIIHWLTTGRYMLDLILVDEITHHSMLTLSQSSSPENLTSDQSTVNTRLEIILSHENGGFDLHELFLYNTKGEILASSDPVQIGKNVRLKPYFQPSLIASYIQPPYYEIGDNDLSIVVSQPLKDEAGQVVGVLAAHLDLAVLGEIMTNRTGLGDSGETYLVSRENNYLLTPSNVEGYPPARAYHSEGIDRAIKGENGSGVYVNYQTPPEPVIGVYYWLPEIQAGLLAEIDRDEAFVIFNQNFYFSLMVIMGTILVATAVGLIVATYVSRPIIALTEIASQISEGDLVAQNTINSPNEIGVLAKAFNKMTERLRESFESLHEKNEQLHHEIDERKQAEYNVKCSNEELSASNEELRATEEELLTLNHNLELEVKERKQAEDAMREAKETAISANRAKSEFLANMSHELRTPLNGILGYAQILLRDRSLDETQQEGVTTIQQSGEHLLTLINDILDMSKIEAGRLEIVSSEFHFVNFLTNIVKIVNIRAEQNKIGFIYEPLTDLPTAVKGDEKRLRQVLINLLGNAIKFTEKGGVAFKVGPHYGKIRFQIEDTGIGISEEQLLEIFQPFRQVGESRFTTEGTGLGLSISKRLVEAMGSELKVTSTPGHGSIFWMDLDLPEVEGWQDGDIDTTPSIIGYKRESPIKLLVVDDKVTNRSMVISLLEPLGFQIFEAVNGQEGVERTATLKPDVILMDIVMPLMDGLQATKAIRESDHSPIIIAASASAFENDRERSLAAGCDDFIPKPIHVNHLLKLLGSYLKLQWMYEQGVDAEILADETTLFVLPPSDTLQAMFDLASKGDFRQLMVQLTEFEEDKKYKPFVAEIEPLIKNYKMKQTRRLLKSYLEELFIDSVHHQE